MGHLRVVGVAVLGVLASAACTRLNFIECTPGDNSPCDYDPAAVCTANPATGTGWCALPDETCPSGYRWDDVAVGDDVANTCVPDDGTACTVKLAWNLSHGTGNAEIYVANPDGTDQRSLTPAAGGTLSWSPDGRLLAHERNGPNSTSEIWVIDVNGNNARAITTGNVDRDPRWSPDGDMIAFLRRPGGPTSEIWVVDVETRDATHLSPEPDARDQAPAWSPGGDAIAFRADGDVFVMMSDGTQRRNLSQDGMVEASVGGPTWSPDGTRVVYTSRISGDPEIWSVDADGGAPQNLTQSPSTFDWGQYGTPQWSPDGAVIYFNRGDLTTAEDFQLFRMNANGGAQTPLGLMVYSSGVAEFDGEPALSPDGATLAWSSWRDGNAEIYTAALPAGPAVRLTNFAEADLGPAWRRCP